MKGSLTLFGEKEGVSCSWTLSKLQTEMIILIYLVPKDEKTMGTNWFVFFTSSQNMPRNTNSIRQCFQPIQNTRLSLSLVKGINCLTLTHLTSISNAQDIISTKDLVKRIIAMVLIKNVNIIMIHSFLGYPLHSVTRPTAFLLRGSSAHSNSVLTSA